MDTGHEDCFVVFLRKGPRHYAKAAPGEEGVEREIAVCGTYEEARRVRQGYLNSAQECIIRYVGPTGGGD